MTERVRTFSITTFQILRTLGVILGFAIVTIMTTNTSERQHTITQIVERTQEKLRETQETVEATKTITEANRETLAEHEQLSTENQRLLAELRPLFRDIVERQKAILYEHARTLAQLGTTTDGLESSMARLTEIEAHLVEAVRSHQRLEALFQERGPLPPVPAR
jgi:hypothetical protein